MCPSSTVGDSRMRRAKCDCGTCERCKKRIYDHERYLANREAKLAQNKAWADAHVEEQREYRRRYREENHEEVLQRNRDWYWSDPETRREKAKAYYRDHREDQLAKRSLRYREKKDEHYAQHRQWIAENPERWAEIRRRNKHKRRGAEFTEEAEEYLPVLAADPCSYCGEPADSVDHIQAITQGGSSDWDNLTAACRKCNAQKNAKSLLDFLLWRTA